MKRFENWPSELARMIAVAEREPFEWGKNDCCLWTADVVHALTGVDYAEQFRGAYDTEEQAYMIMDLLGEPTIKETVTVLLGEPININFVQRGDVVMGIFDGAQTLGICIGAKVAFKTLNGLIQLPLAKCDCAWRIG